jgi:alpha-tubulin suppressor-like RCC1 family protein
MNPINAFIISSDDGCVWTCGKFQSLKLDKNDSKGNFAHQFMPRKVDFESVLPKGVKVVRVQCGLQHSCAIAGESRTLKYLILPF